MGSETGGDTRREFLGRQICHWNRSETGRGDILSNRVVCLAVGKSPVSIK